MCQRIAFLALLIAPALAFAQGEAMSQRVEQLRQEAVALEQEAEVYLITAKRHVNANELESAEKQMQRYRETRSLAKAARELANKLQDVLRNPYRGAVSATGIHSKGCQPVGEKSPCAFRQRFSWRLAMARKFLKKIDTARLERKTNMGTWGLLSYRGVPRHDSLTSCTGDQLRKLAQGRGPLVSLDLYDLLREAYDSRSPTSRHNGTGLYRFSGPMGGPDFRAQAKSIAQKDLADYGRHFVYRIVFKLNDGSEVALDLGSMHAAPVDAEPVLINKS